MMRTFTVLLLTLIMSFSAGIYAEESISFSNVSAGIFRFQMKLAEQGNPEAQYIVGEMYETGSAGVEDSSKALKWFEKSAAQGHKKSRYKLLFLEIQSNGLNDFTKSQLGVLRHEAASGNANAQYFLGKMYAAGVGVPKSLTNALTWLNKATFNGIAEAEHEAIAVEEELDIIRDQQAKKRVTALAAAQKRKADQDRIRAAKLKKDKQRKAASAKRKSTQSAEAQRSAAQRRRIDEDRRILEEEKLRLERERKIVEAELARNAKLEQKQTQKVKTEASYESDPCKGKSARFLSTCR